MYKNIIRSLLLVTMMVFALPLTSINAKTKVTSQAYETMIEQSYCYAQDSIEETRVVTTSVKHHEDMPQTGDHAEFIIFYSIFLVALSILVRMKKRKAYQ